MYDVSHLQNLQIWPSLVCFPRKLHTVILIIGSIVNMNVKCMLGILQTYVGYIVSSGDQACHNVFALAAIFLVSSLHVEYYCTLAMIITPHACARCKVIGLSACRHCCRHCLQKIGKSRDVCAMASSVVKPSETSKNYYSLLLCECGPQMVFFQPCLLTTPSTASCSARGVCALESPSI